MHSVLSDAPATCTTTKVFEKYGFTAYKADDISETDDKDAETTEEADDTETNAETETTEEAK